MSSHRFGPGRIGLALIVLCIITCFPKLAPADDLPASVAALLPDGLVLTSQDWGLFKGEEESEGATFTGQMGAGFPGSVSCDITVGPNFNLELKGQTAWESDPELMDMFVQMYVPESEVHAEKLSEGVKWMLGASSSSGELAIGEPRDEQLPNGHIVYIDFTWKCTKNPAGKNVLLKGFARRGTTVLTFNFWSNGDVADARTMAVGILDKFEKLDIQALIQ